MRSSLWLGCALVVLPTLLRLYLLWPFPGSQELVPIAAIHALDRALPFLQAAGGALLLIGAAGALRRGPRRGAAIGAGVALLLSGGALYAAHRMAADAIFRPPEALRFARGTSEALPPETLVLGLVSGPVAKAYPIRLLAYHHRVEDELGGRPVLVTYCTMCRTGRVFRRAVGGQSLHLDLVGAVRWNSVYADRKTGSWWYQANGRAVAGPLAGERLEELPADQMTLGRWLELFPDSLVMQPDSASAAGYELFGFDGFDERRSSAEDPEERRWVVGVVVEGLARAYPWARLAERRLIQDEPAGVPIAVHLLPDEVSFRVWDRRAGERVLDLEPSESGEELLDAASGSRFGFDGVARGGALEGTALEAVPAVSEYWFSFRYFSGGELVDPGAPAGS